MRVILAVLALVASLLSGGVGPANATSVGAAAPQFRKQVYTWQWADGSTATQRSFPSSTYANRTNEIALLVQVRPALPRHKVLIQVYQGGQWQTIARKQTKRSTGRVRLQINPICQSGKWCRGTFDLRLRVLKKGRQNPATLGMQVTFDPGQSTSPVVPPPSKPRVTSTLAQPRAFQLESNATLGAPTITRAQALQNPDKRSEVVIDVMWDAPVSYADNPVSGYYLLMGDSSSITSGEPSWYVEYGADERDVRVRGSIIFANNPPQTVVLSVVAVDSRGQFGESAPAITLQIGCDVYGPDTGPANPYRTLCEHSL